MTLKEDCDNCDSFSMYPCKQCTICQAYRNTYGTFVYFTPTKTYAEEHGLRYYAKEGEK